MATPIPRQSSTLAKPAADHTPCECSRPNEQGAASMAETKSVADFVIQRLYDWGVRCIYGYPGDGVNALAGSLARRQADIKFVQARHEEEAAFMACAHAKYSGEVGV